MEGVQTVDVSWLHHSQKDHLSRTKSVSAVDKPATDAEPVPSQPKSHRRSRSSSNPARPTPPPHTSEVNPNQPPKNDPAPVQAKPIIAEKTEDQKPSTPSPSSRKTDPKPIGRRNSWISSLSSKFSSGSTPPSQSSLKSGPASPKTTTSPLDAHNPFGAAYSPKDKEEEKKDDSNSFTSTSPKGPSFLHNALRKFSSNSGGLPKLHPNGTVCPRRVMNIDQNRHRCKIADLNQAKLNRVAFCVDVEIAGISHRDDDEEAPPTNQLRQPLSESNHKSKKADLKSKEQDEAGALKDPQATLAGKDGSAPAPAPVPAPTDVPAVAAATPPASPAVTSDAAPSPAPAVAFPPIPVSAQTAVDAKAQPSSPPKDAINNNPSTIPAPSAEGTDPTRKQEKKKRSEAERKERKERKRRQAVANGTVPLQLDPEHDEEYTRGPAPAPALGGSRSKTQGHPTTDPVRIYRRCCQLRETPVLKRVVDEISKPSSTLAESPGTVAALDLSNFPMTSQDLATFSDWLAVVPVRKLLLENCSLTDASVRAILAALLSTKTIEQMRYRRKRSRRPEAPGSTDHERYGVVEKLSLKNNPKIGREGWRYISLFVHLSKSLKAIDLSGIPFPQGQVAIDGSGTAGPNQTATADVSAVFASALAERFGGDHLEELLMSECYPSVDAVKQICQAATKMGLRRLGFASNGLTREGLEHVVEYFKAGQCEGLDLGGNVIKDDLDLVTAAIEPETPLYALSLADCGLTSSVITTLLQSLAQIHNLRFIDFSHNRELFSTHSNALGAFRRFLPKMTSLKRVHLADVNLSPDHVIGLAEVLPECPSLCHLNILENEQIVSLASTTDPEAQEEACAVYASMMAAVRVSRTIIAVDIDVPSAENNEVVKALASQIVAYSLRNLEGGAIAEELSGSTGSLVDVPVPEILQHIVGNAIPSDEPCDDEDDTAPDADYVIGGTGVVKALGVCLKNLDHQGLDALGEHSAPASGTTTPRRRKSRAVATKRPRDMSKNLLESARNIRARIQSALIREDRAGNDANYRRLQFLDITLHRMIQRFEDEYPETRIIPQAAPAAPLPDTISQHSGDDDGAGSITAGGNLNSTQLDDTGVDEEDTDQYAVRHSRTSSMTSLHSRAMTSQEGHIHRLGQNLRREILNPSLVPGDGDENFDIEDNNSHIAALRQKLDRLHEEQCLSQFDDFDSDMAYNHLGTTVDELFAAQQQDAEAFERFKQSQIAAQINSGIRPRDIPEPKSCSESGVSESKSS
ncbi:Leucine-rich repeat ribonuclease inhibitor subtype [Penicillium bovifimosum]|uniref:Leucine-rich repeat ribonuclease inhibitor subtype n=1 Tax=Penicillium bovifimosum TaxID=126998 RepID=A0A9W9H0J1_9EURO|nr:Leucine-rich repeat ribonuclease inhibitor subtype [Penicillium bovifimosum]KAJ5135384.1 Leucine-rich repeat ribonuclease inhibitor subtype [Penicillium bovifimosum]